MRRCSVAAEVLLNVFHLCVHTGGHHLSIDYLLHNGLHPPFNMGFVLFNLFLDFGDDHHLLFFILSPLLHLSLQQPPVLCDLQLQPHLDVQQLAVLGLLLLDRGSELLQLRLQHVNAVLQLAKLKAVSSFNLSYVLLQALNLQGREEVCDDCSQKTTLKGYKVNLWVCLKSFSCIKMYI